MIVVRRRFRAAPERVFDAWLDPAIARRWLFATPGGEIVRCDIHARVGGGWFITDRRADGDAEHTGEYVEIDRPRRLVFTFGVPAVAGDKALVEIDIRPLPEGGCELTLTQQMPSEFAEYRERTEQGWRTLLEGLAQQTDG